MNVVLKSAMGSGKWSPSVYGFWKAEPNPKNKRDASDRKTVQLRRAEMMAFLNERC